MNWIACTGTCSGGPWEGQYIEADTPYLDHPWMTGHYKHNVSRDCWDWMPGKLAPTNHVDQS